MILPDPDPYDIDVQPLESARQASAAQIRSNPAELYPHHRIRTVTTDDSEAEYSFARDRVVPTLLLLTGLAIRVCEIPYDRTLGRSNLAESVGIMLFQVILAVALMLAGVLIASKILAANFGPVGTALLKLAGIAIFAFAVGAAIVVSLQYEVRAFVVAMHVIFIIYAITFWMLFSLDVQEALLTVAICALLQNAAGFVIFAGG